MTFWMFNAERYIQPISHAGTSIVSSHSQIELSKYKIIIGYISSVGLLLDSFGVGAERRDSMDVSLYMGLARLIGDQHGSGI